MVSLGAKLVEPMLCCGLGDEAKGLCKTRGEVLVSCLRVYGREEVEEGEEKKIGNSEDGEA